MLTCSSSKLHSSLCTSLCSAKLPTAAQVFDKALSEPTFSALYAQLCLHLSSELPDFTEDTEDGKQQKVTFRRIILNKCQSEFEKGAAAMTAVENREQQQAKAAEDKVCPPLVSPACCMPSPTQHLP